MNIKHNGLHAASGAEVRYGVVWVTADYTVTDADDVILVDTTGQAVDITIPDSIVENGWTITIRDAGGNSSVNGIGIATQTISSEVTSIDTNNAKVCLIAYEGDLFSI